MAKLACAKHTGIAEPRGLGKALLLTLPIVLWSLLISLRGFFQPNRSMQFASLMTTAEKSIQRGTGPFSWLSLNKNTTDYLLGLAPLVVVTLLAWRFLRSCPTPSTRWP